MTDSNSIQGVLCVTHKIGADTMLTDVSLDEAQRWLAQQPIGAVATAHFREWCDDEWQEPTP